jgi:hypothetical protein
MERINLRSKTLNFNGVDPTSGMDLLTVFWNRQHSLGSIVYRPYFMRDMACQGPYFSELLLYSMLFSATKHASQPCLNVPDPGGRGLTFRQEFERIIHESHHQILYKSSITTIQALLIMAETLFSWCDETSLSWHFLSMGINMIIDLGIHSGSSKTSDCAVETETKRRLFWAAFGN